MIFLHGNWWWRLLCSAKSTNEQYSAFKLQQHPPKQAVSNNIVLKMQSCCKTSIPGGNKKDFAYYLPFCKQLVCQSPIQYVCTLPVKISCLSKHCVGYYFLGLHTWYWHYMYLPSNFVINAVATVISPLTDLTISCSVPINCEFGCSRNVRKKPSLTFSYLCDTESQICKTWSILCVFNL